MPESLDQLESHTYGIITDGSRVVFASIAQVALDDLINVEPNKELIPLTHTQAQYSYYPPKPHPTRPISS